MAELGNNEINVFIISLVLIIAGIYWKKDLLYYIGMMFVAGLTGWVMRGDSNGGHKNNM